MLGATRIIAKDVAGEAKNIVVEKMVMNTRDAPPGEARRTTLAKWIRLSPMVMGMQQTGL